MSIAHWISVCYITLKFLDVLVPNIKNMSIWLLLKQENSNLQPQQKAN